MKKPKILITCIHWAVSSGRYVSSALRRMGYDVKTCGPEAHSHIWGMQVPGKYIWQPDIGMGVNVLDSRIEYVLKRLDGWQPNLVINMDSAFDVVGEREEYPCPKVLYGVDNHVRDYARNRLNWYDHYFLAHYDGPALAIDGARDDMTWLSCAYDDLAFQPSDIPMPERYFDVAMVGYPYARREQAREALLNTKMNAQFKLGALYDEYATIYHNARISLCVSAYGDLAQRVFETAAMGCVILTDALPDLRRLGAVEGKHYVEYTTIEDMVNKAQDLLKYPARMADIAAAGQAFFKPHTWQTRAQTILDTMGLS